MANTDSSLDSRVPPHRGQVGSDDDRTSASNSLSQPSHRYSKIGMFGSFRDSKDKRSASRPALTIAGPGANLGRTAITERFACAP